MPVTHLDAHRYLRWFVAHYSVTTRCHMKQFLVVAAVFTVLFLALTYGPTQNVSPAPIVQGPDYNKPGKLIQSKPAAAVNSVKPEEYRIPVNTRSQDVDRTKCDPCTGRAWTVKGIVDLFEDNEVIAEEEFSGRSGLVNATIDSIETNLVQGARITFVGPFFGPTVICMFNSSTSMSDLAKLHKGQTIPYINFYGARRYLRSTIILDCMYY